MLRSGKVEPTNEFRRKQFNTVAISLAHLFPSVSRLMRNTASCHCRSFMRSDIAFARGSCGFCNEGDGLRVSIFGCEKLNKESLRMKRVE